MIVIAAVVEALVRPDVTWRIVAFALCLLLAAATLWRRTHPLPVVVVVFGTTVVLALAASASGQPLRPLRDGLRPRPAVRTVPLGIRA